jgi:DNA-binding NtrC family response regulator
MQKRKLMIIDDDEDFLDELEESLSSAGYEVTTFTNATDARHMVDTIKPDAILIDLYMPGKSGFVATAELTRLQDTSHIPVIAMSGHYNDRMHAVLIAICGAKEFLKKPFDIKMAIEAIEKVLSAAV